MNAPRLLRSSWTWLTIGLLLVGLISLIGSGQGAAPPALDAGSAKPNGALALRRWLQRVGYPLDVSGNRPDIARLARSGTVALLAAGSDLSSHDTDSLLAWVRAGGRLVLASDGATNSAALHRLNIDVSAVGQEPVTVDQPLLLSPPVASLSGQTSALLSGSQQDVEVAAAPDGSVLLLRRLGRGLIWVLSAPMLLDNAHIGRADNRRLALNLAGPPGTPVLLDQYRPPTGGTNGDWLTSSAWGVALLLLIAIFVLYRWLAGVRLGPTVTPLRLQYRPAAEYVVSLAGLLERGRRREDVLRIYQTSLERLIRRRFGSLENSSLDRSRQDELQQLLRPASRLSEAELLRRAAAIMREEERVRDER